MRTIVQVLEISIHPLGDTAYRVRREGTDENHSETFLADLVSMSSLKGLCLGIFSQNATNASRSFAAQPVESSRNLRNLAWVTLMNAESSQVGRASPMASDWNHLLLTITMIATLARHSCG